MLKRYKRINILVPKKEETRKALYNIYKTLREIFGGYTEKELFLVKCPASGIYKDPQNGKIILDRHTSIDVDTGTHSLAQIYDCIIDVKHLWEKDFDEQEIWMTIQSIYKIE